jgi:hypothetical protein
MHKEILEDALVLIRTKGWTRNANARNAAQRQVDLYASDATCFCLIGAVFRAMHDKGLSELPLAEWDLIKCSVLNLLRQPDAILLAPWNDHPLRTQAEVEARIEMAIGRAA